MSKIRSKNTKFEEDFIDNLKNIINVRFERNSSQIFGKPDIVFAGKKVSIFLDSDFWHGWQYSRWQHLMKNDFWRNKILRNRKRDLNVTRYLKRHGWTVLRIWEHQLKKDQPFYLEKIRKLILR